ncbi:fasciclin-like arabinogalactan protein 3 [Pistacia vera]|uniref:fasciclin-like arabinogalactan protein 3 n=1 Tax=Pistacia vera TaxID=55513 RepID=UPI001262D4F5|nr:fasciclin-like arabinogalactan protein 3 [Pistacia vera]
MSLRTLAPCVLLVALFTSSLTNAFNITKILSNTSDFGSFNNLLSQSGLAETINSRSSLTILALDNGAVGSLQGKSKDEVQRILTNHVVLDYIDQNKLKNLPKKTTTMTTLLQTSGVAQQGQGFSNVTVSGNDILFGSEVKDSPLAARFVKSVYAEPYNSSQSIVAPGIGAPALYTTLPPPPPSRKAPAPSPMTRKVPPPGPGPADSGAPCALGSGAAVAVLMGLVLHFVGL